AATILGQLNQKACFRVSEPGTADWFSRCIGNALGWEPTSIGPDGKVTYGLTKREGVMSSEIQNLPLPSEEEGFCGRYISSNIGVWAARLPWNFVMRKLNAVLGRATEPNFVPWPDDEKWRQVLRPWDEDDLKRLKLDGPDDEDEAGGGEGPSTPPP